MKSHKVYTAPAPEGEEPYIFVEIEKDSYLGISGRPSHEEIHAQIAKEERTGRFALRMNRRYFALHDTPLTALESVTE